MSAPKMNAGQPLAWRTAYQAPMAPASQLRKSRKAMKAMGLFEGMVMASTQRDQVLNPSMGTNRTKVRQAATPRPPTIMSGKTARPSQPGPA